MKVTNRIGKFQQGGVAPEAVAQPGAEQSQEQGGGAEEQIMQMAQQIIEQVGPEGAAMLAQTIMQMLQGAQEQAPQGQPQYARKGGKLTFIGRK